MSIEGRLQDVGLADICQLLAMGRKTGCLSVTDRAHFGHIFFEDGRVVHATVLNRRERLGELLVHNGAVPEAKLREARAAASSRPNVHYARLLVESEDLSQEDLERFQTVEVEEAVYHLFAWEEGTFHFQTDRLPEEGVPLRLSLPAENLLLEGARRVDEWTQISEVVSSFDLVFSTVERDASTGDEGERPPAHEKVLTHLDGRRTLAQVVREAGMVEFDVARAIYELSREELVEPIGRAEPADEEDAPAEEPPAERALNLGRAFYEAGMLEEAKREFEECLRHDPERVEALERLGLIALREGRNAEALGYLDRADDVAEPAYGRMRNRALALEALDRLDEALDVLEAAQARAHDDPDFHLAVGIARLKSFEPEEALQAFRTYRELLGEGEQPAPIFFAHAVLAAAMAGEADESLRLGREGLQLHPWSGPLLVNLGHVLERRGELAAAETLYLRAVGETNTPAQAHRNLGDLAFRRGDEAAARGHYERAVRLDPELGDGTFLRLGNLFYAEGDEDAARRLWRRALELNPANEVARSNLGLLAAGSRS